MNIRSAKAKGRVLQHEVVDEFKALYPELSSRDIHSTPMGVPGSDVTMSQIAVDKIGFVDIECKNAEELNVYKAITQVRKRVGDTQDYLIVFRKNRFPPHALVSMEKFMSLLKELKTLRENNKTLLTLTRGE